MKIISNSSKEQIIVLTAAISGIVFIHKLMDIAKHLWEEDYPFFNSVLTCIIALFLGIVAVFFSLKYDIKLANQEIERFIQFKFVQITQINEFGFEIVTKSQIRDSSGFLLESKAIFWDQISECILNKDRTELVFKLKKGSVLCLPNSYENWYVLITQIPPSILKNFDVLEFKEKYFDNIPPK